MSSMSGLGKREGEAAGAPLLASGKEKRGVAPGSRYLGSPITHSWGLPGLIPTWEVRVPILFCHPEGWGGHANHCQCPTLFPSGVHQPASRCLRVPFVFLAKGFPWLLEPFLLFTAD